MGNSRAIAVRKRALKRANVRAQRRFHTMLESGLFFDETARVTRLYVEAERLIDALLVTPHPTPVAVVVESLRLPSRVEDEPLTGRDFDQRTATGRAAAAALEGRLTVGHIVDMALEPYPSKLDEYQTRGA